MFKCLSAGKYIKITMKGRKNDTFRTRVLKYDQCNGGVGERRRNTCTKVEGRDVSVNTYYSQYLFRNCCASVVNQL